MKTVFVSNALSPDMQKAVGDGMIVCPFLGYKVANMDEFIELLKTKLYVKDPSGKQSYPAMVFTLKNGMELLFTGHHTRFNDNPDARWQIRKDDRVLRYIKSIREDDGFFEFLPDAEEVEKEVKALQQQIQANPHRVVRIVVPF